MNKIDSIIENAEKNKDIFLNKKYAKAKEIVINFIESKKRIIYGGTALDILLKKKQESIYPEYKFPDFDIYSPDYFSDAIELCNLLYDAGFKFVRVLPALHPSTAKIQIDFSVAICDITYIPENIYFHLFNNSSEGITYPDFLKISIYKSLINIENVYRWKKDIERLIIFNKFYPTISSKNSSTSSNKENYYEIIISLFDLLNQYSKKLLYTGIFAYNIFDYIGNNPNYQSNLSASIFSDIIINNKISTLEIVNVKKDSLILINTILIFLTKNNIVDSSKIKFHIYSGNFQTSLPNKYTILIDDIPIIIIYDYYGTNHNYIDINGILITNSIFLLYLFYEYKFLIQITDNNFFAECLTNIYKNSENINKFIVNINNLSTNYLSSNKLHGSETKFKKNGIEIINIFQIIGDKYIGHNLFNTSKKAIQYRKINKFIIPMVNFPVYYPDITKISTNQIVKKLPNFEINIYTSEISLEILFSRKNYLPNNKKENKNKNNNDNQNKNDDENESDSENKNDDDNESDSENKNKNDDENENDDENKNDDENESDSENNNKNENKSENESENESENNDENKNESENNSENESEKKNENKMKINIPMNYYGKLIYKENYYHL